MQKADKRSQLELLVTLVRSTSTPIRKYPLMYATFMSWDMVNRYLELALVLSLIEKDGDYYKITERGQELLSKTHIMIMEKA